MGGTTALGRRFLLAKPEQANHPLAPDLPELRIEPVAARKALRRHASGLRTFPAPFGHLIERAVVLASCAVGPCQPLAGLERRHIADTAVLVALQTHTFAASHLGNLRGREQEQFAVLTDDRDHIAFNRHRHLQFDRFRHIHHLLALAGVGDDVRLRRNEPITLGVDQQKFTPRIVHEESDDILSGIQIDHDAQRIAVAAATR